MGNRTVDLYKLFKNGEQANGIKVVRAVTVEPDPLTFVFEGTKLAIDAEIFEIPYTMYPVRKGDRFLTYPMHSTGPASRWALLQKLNGCIAHLATMQGVDSLKIDGIDNIYAAADIIIPAGQVLQTGDKVIVLPVLDNEEIRYAILAHYA